MSLKRWLESGLLTPHETSKREIQDLFALVDRDIDDARTAGLSSDRQFLIANEAALNLATIAVYASGYETRGRGHHFRTFAVLPEVVGREMDELSLYFEVCRAKRNRSTYDRTGEISATDADELIREVIGFRHLIRAWLKDHHPALT